MNAKLSSVGTPGVYFDGRPTGGGKTTSDIEAFRLVDREGGRSLLILPTHANAIEAEHDLQQNGLAATKYPARLTEDATRVCPKCEGNGDDCSLCFGVGKLEFPRNCWNRDADKAEALGLNVVSAICPNCDLFQNCQSHGYLAGIRSARESDVAVATHARGAAQGIGQLAESREFVSVHEDAIGLLRPSVEVNESDQQKVEDIARRLVEEPRWLNYFGNGKTPEQRQRRQAQREFACHFATVCEAVGTRWDRAGQTQPLHPVATMDVPAGFLWTLFLAAKQRNLTLGAPAFRVLLDHVAGKLHSLSIVVSSRPATYILNWAFTSMDMIKAHASGTTFAEISKKNFRPLPIVLPPSDAIAAYQQSSEPLFHLLTHSVKESDQLSAMRDYLLPRLLSGSVRVRS